MAPNLVQLVIAYTFAVGVAVYVIQLVKGAMRGS